MIEPRKKGETPGERTESLREVRMAMLNILEDFNQEKERLFQTQRALLNIMDDLNQSSEELKKAHDVLEVKVAERTADLQQRTLEMESSNKELEAFAYSVSHDLRAPLRSMQGFASAVLEDYADKLDETGKDYLLRIQQSSELMARLIDDILKLSRVTRAEMHWEKVDLSKMAGEILTELARQEPERQVKYNVASGLVVYGDARLIHILLENLLGNAWKFTGKVAEARIELGVTERNGKRTYFVRDNGAGFDMRYIDKLFRPFQRLHKSSDFPGTGIGLATVQRIVRRHGGEVWAEGEVGNGAAFYFTL